MATKCYSSNWNQNEICHYFCCELTTLCDQIVSADVLDDTLFQQSSSHLVWVSNVGHNVSNHAK